MKIQGFHQQEAVEHILVVILIITFGLWSVMHLVICGVNDMHVTPPASTALLLIGAQNVPFMSVHSLPASLEVDLEQYCSL